MLIMAYALKTSSANSIVGVIPYLPYSKQCKMRKRGAVVTKLVAQMMVKSGMTHIITMDLHQKEIQGFFDCPVDNLRASPFLLQYIQESVSISNCKKMCIDLPNFLVLQIPDYRNAVIVARNPGSAKKATSYAERLRLGIAVIHGEQKESDADEVSLTFKKLCYLRHFFVYQVDGRYSPPTVPRSRTMDAGVGVPIHIAKEKPPINVVGDVGGRIAIMVVSVSFYAKRIFIQILKIIHFFIVFILTSRWRPAIFCMVSLVSRIDQLNHFFVNCFR